MVLKLGEIQDLSEAELNEQLQKSRLALVDLRMKLASRQLDNVSILRATRKEIARILTVQTQKQKEGYKKPKQEQDVVSEVKKKKKVVDKKKTTKAVSKTKKGNK